MVLVKHEINHQKIFEKEKKKKKKLIPLNYTLFTAHIKKKQINQRESLT